MLFGLRTKITQLVKDKIRPSYPVLRCSVRQSSPAISALPSSRRDACNPMPHASTLSRYLRATDREIAGATQSVFILLEITTDACL